MALVVEIDCDARLQSAYSAIAQTVMYRALTQYCLFCVLMCAHKRANWRCGEAHIQLYMNNYDV